MSSAATKEGCNQSAVHVATEGLLVDQFLVIDGSTLCV